MLKYLNKVIDDPEGRAFTEWLAPQAFTESLLNNIGFPKRSLINKALNGLAQEVIAVAIWEHRVITKDWQDVREGLMCKCNNKDWRWDCPLPKEQHGKVEDKSRSNRSGSAEEEKG